MDSSTYGQLNIFHAIASEGSISAAARRLGMATASASQSLKQLEATVGVPLFVRTTRRIQLTEAGQQLLQRTKGALQSLQDAIEDVQSQGQEPSGSVRITLSRFAWLLVLKPLFAEFCRRYPKLQLDISIQDGTINLIDQGIDMGIRFNDVVDEGMVARRLLPSFREGLFATRRYLDAHGTPRTPADLSHHALVGYRFITSNRLYPLTLKIGDREETVDMPTSIICNDIDVMNDAIRAGLGIGRIFEPIHSLQPDRDAFIPVLEPYWRPYPPVCLYYLQKSQKAKRVQVLVEFLLDRLTSARPPSA